MCLTTPWVTLDFPFPSLGTARAMGRMEGGKGGRGKGEAERGLEVAYNAR